MRRILPAVALLVVACAWGLRDTATRRGHPAPADRPGYSEAGVVSHASAPEIAPTDCGGRDAGCGPADLKRRLFEETDLRKKWAIVCRLATMPETEHLFADPADRRRLDAIIEEVRLAIKRGELKEAQEEP